MVIVIISPFGNESRWIEAEREEALRGGSSKGDERIGDAVHREETMHAFGAGPRKCPGAVSISASVFEREKEAAAHQCHPKKYIPGPTLFYPQEWRAQTLPSKAAPFERKYALHT